MLFHFWMFWERSHSICRYFTFNLQGTEEYLAFFDIRCRHFSREVIGLCRWWRERFRFCWMYAHFCFVYMAFRSEDWLWKMFAYEIGGDAGPYGKESGVNRLDPGGGNWKESRLMEVADECWFTVLLPGLSLDNQSWESLGSDKHNKYLILTSCSTACHLVWILFNL